MATPPYYREIQWPNITYPAAVYATIIIEFRDLLLEK